MRTSIACLLIIVVAFGVFAASHTPSAAQDNGDPVAERLNSLGVNTNAGPRRDASGRDLPDSFSPLGQRYMPARTAELALVSLPLADRTEPFTLLEDLANGGGPLTTISDAPYLAQSIFSRGLPYSLRDATAADVDGDGFEEVVIVYMRESEVVMQVIDDQQAQFASSETVVQLAENVQDVVIGSADVNADGRTEIIVSAGRPGSVDLMIVDLVDGRYGVAPDARQVLNASGAENMVFAEIASGNLDYDSAEEFVYILNERIDDQTGLAQYMVFDDASTGYARLTTGIVQGLVDGIQTAVIGNVDIGDVDGDGLGEIVIGGLTNFSELGSCTNHGLLLLTFDDATNNFVDIGTSLQDYYLDDCPAFSPWQLRYVHVNTLDLDGDAIDEIEVNEIVFDDLLNAAPWTELYRIPLENFLQVNDFGWFDRSTIAIETGDFTGDGREDIISYAQNRNEIGVWGVGGPEMAWGKLGAVPVAFFNAQNPISPILVPVNVDGDSPILEYSAGEYQLVFTEPILIAALAAAPCNQEFGQDAAACTTSFGQSQSGSTTTENSVSLSASTSVGISLEDRIISQSALEVSATVSAYVTLTQSENLSRTDTVTYTTGPLEDTVIFTTVPVDRYKYTILSHPDPVMIGREVQVDMPRKPVTLMVERSFYNQNAAPGAVAIDDRIFAHAIGDPRSYPTRGQALQLLQQYNGFQSELQNVGQGTGQRSVQIEIGREVSSGRELGVGFEYSFQATAGSVMAGYTVGAEASNNLSISVGSSTIYEGSVGNMDANSFAGNAYGYGLFSYVYSDPATGQEFQVLNYWVE